MDAWIDEELAANTLPDQRLKKRCRTLLAQLWSRIGNTIPASCQDLAATKAAYRFFSNSEGDSGHDSGRALRGYRIAL